MVDINDHIESEMLEEYMNKKFKRPIELQIRKRIIHRESADHTIERLFSYPQCEWITPTNKEHSDYDIFFMLSQMIRN